MVTAVVKSQFQDAELILILMRMNQEGKAEASSVGFAPVHCGSRNVHQEVALQKELSKSFCKEAEFRSSFSTLQ